MLLVWGFVDIAGACTQIVNAEFKHHLLLFCSTHAGKPPLIVTYFVSGQKKCDAGGEELPMEIASLVPENLLEETKKKLYKVILNFEPDFQL